MREPEPIHARLAALDTRKDAGRRAALARLFSAVGCPQQFDAPVAKGTLDNLICRLPGKISRRILVGAHFDQTREGRGIVDNWSGSSMLANLVESLLPIERRHEFLFVGFSAEERGLVGSRAYVRAMTDAERAELAAMINIDSIGMGPLRIEMQYSDDRLVCEYLLAQALIKQPVAGLNFGFGISSDFDAFRRAGFPTLNFTSYHREWWKILHQRRDQLPAIDRDAYYASYRSIAMTLAVLDANLSREPEAPNVMGRAESAPRRKGAP